MRALQQNAHSKVAVMLNANAKRVTPRIRERLEQQCDGIDVYYSRSLEEARLITRQMLEANYHTILTGGGDGTIIQTINTLYQLTGRMSPRPAGPREDRRLQPVPAPRSSLPAVGILKLGTGNALASVVGAGRFDQDVAKVRRLMEDGVEPLRTSLPLMECEGQVFPFAGLGWDAAVLNDYNRLKENASNPLSKALFKSVMGYLAAAFTMSVPRLAVTRPPEVEIRALSEATLIGPNGEPAKHFNRGAVLYRGPISMVAFATIPYYGYEFTMFPFARALTDRFQLRVASTGIPEVVSHLPGLWKGTYRSPRLMDYYCERVTMSFSRPVPYQVGGEAMGEREALTVGMSSYPVDLVDYRTSVGRTLPALTRPMIPSFG